MDTRYDMCLDHEELCRMEKKLNENRETIYRSDHVMAQNLIEGEAFLEGEQFEKAKAATLRCIQYSGRTCDNIKNALTFIEQLKECLETYTQCAYPEEMK